MVIMKYKEIALIAFTVCMVGFSPFDTYVLHHGDAKYAENKAKAQKLDDAKDAQARANKEREVLQNCAAARQKHDQLYKAGVANPDEQVDVRAACEPDKVAQESYTMWVLGALLLVAAIFFFPMLMFGMAPG
jgi:hypothetical protein